MLTSTVASAIGKPGLARAFYLSARNMKTRRSQPKDVPTQEIEPKLPDVWKPTHYLLKFAPFVGFFLVNLGLFSTWKGWLSSDWEETEGVVEELLGFRVGKMAIGTVSYSYQDPFIDQREADQFGVRESDTIKGYTFAASNPWLGPSVFRWNEKYEPGKKIPVYYSKADRKNSCLHKGIYTPFQNMYVFGVGIAIFFLPLWI